VPPSTRRVCPPLYIAILPPNGSRSTWRCQFLVFLPRVQKENLFPPPFGHSALLRFPRPAIFSVSLLSLETEKHIVTFQRGRSLATRSPSRVRLFFFFFCRCRRPRFALCRARPSVFRPSRGEKKSFFRARRAIISRPAKFLSPRRNVFLAAIIFLISFCGLPLGSKVSG